MQISGRKRPFVYIEKVSDHKVQLVKNGSKNKIAAFLFLLGVDCSVLLFGEVAGEKKKLGSAQSRGGATLTAGKTPALINCAAGKRLHLSADLT